MTTAHWRIGAMADCEEGEKGLVLSKMHLGQKFTALDLERIYHLLPQL